MYSRSSEPGGGCKVQKQQDFERRQDHSADSESCGESISYQRGEEDGERREGAESRKVRKCAGMGGCSMATPSSHSAILPTPGVWTKPGESGLSALGKRFR